MHRKNLNFIDNSGNSFLEKERLNKDKKSTKKKILFVFIIFFALFLLVIGVRAIRSNNLDYLEYNTITLEPKKPDGLLKKITYFIFNKNIKLEGTKKDRINILLLGQGGLGHEGPYLTDTIIVLSYQPSTNNIALISIPRDLGVELPNYGLTKINHANHVGEMKKENMGGAMATQIISETFDIDIPYYLRVDFKAFVDIIDDIGGVRIDVKNTFSDTEYPTENFTYKTIYFKKGWQTMNGKTALEYARSRHGNNGEGSDFARAARQQQILLAVKEKILSFSTITNPIKLKKMLDTVEKNMVTNMNFEEILEFVRIAKNLGNNNMYNLVLNDSPNGFLNSTIANNGAYLLLPKTGSWDDVKLAIKNIFENTAIKTTNTINLKSTKTEKIVTNTTSIEEINNEEIKLEKEDLKIEIQNGTWQAGLAAKIKQKLIEKDYYVEEIGNTSTDIKPVTNSAIYILNKNIDKSIINELENALSIKTGQNEINSVISSVTSSDILIVIGNDYIN